MCLLPDLVACSNREDKCRGDNASARAQVGNSISLAVVLGAVCVVVLELWTSDVLHVVAGADGVSPETMDIAISYLRCAFNHASSFNRLYQITLFTPFLFVQGSSSWYTIHTDCLGTIRSLSCARQSLCKPGS